MRSMESEGSRKKDCQNQEIYTKQHKNTWRADVRGEIITFFVAPAHFHGVFL